MATGVGSTGLRAHGDKRPRARHFGEDRRGTLQVVETLVVALFVVVAIVAVSSMDVPVTQTEGFKKENEQLLDDSLRAMSQRPSTMADGTLFDSKLEEHVMLAVAGNSGPLMRYLNRTLPAGASYNVLLDNGYGPPNPIVAAGTPPRESVAGSVQFVPKLAYTFLVPEFQYYHGDFHMNVMAVPISHGILQTDEGDTVELAVTFRTVEDGTLSDESFTMKTYGQTALRFNDPNARQWPSVAVYHDPSTSTADDETHFLDLTGYTVPANITFYVGLTETSDVKVPKNTEIKISFPRGWRFNDTALENMRNDAYLGNKDRWKDIEVEGGTYYGTNITARLKEPFQNEEVHFGVNARYGMVLDTAYPYFQPITVTLNNGAQSQSTLIAKPPAPVDVGVFRREAYLSLPKPMISSDQTLWGLSLANNGDTIQIDQVDLRQPQQKTIMTNITTHNGWTAGTWFDGDVPGHFYWQPTDGLQARLDKGDAAWFTVNAQAGTTTDNSYRNQDNQRPIVRTNPDNITSGTNTLLGQWEYEQQLYRMAEEWVYKDSLPPYDDHPGWPDEAANAYTVTGGTYLLNQELQGSAGYTVLPLGLTSNTFGDYQGSHVFSTLDVVDSDGDAAREFELGDRVILKNDFSTVMGNLTALDMVPGIDVADYDIVTSVYTPERAWRGQPSATYTESAAVVTSLGTIAALETADLNLDGVQDVVVVGSTGTIFALDGRDGAKFWTHSISGAVTDAALMDLDADGYVELVVGVTGPKIFVVDARTSLAQGTGRTLVDGANVGPGTLAGTGGYSVDGIERYGTVSDGSRVVLATSAQLLDSMVQAVDITNSGGNWDLSKPGIHYRNTETQRDQDVRILDLEPVDWTSGSAAGRHFAFANQNGTFGLLDGATLTLRWLTPVEDVPVELQAIDLDGDGNEDLIVNTAREPLTEGGRYAHLVNATHGRIAGGTRAIDSDAVDPNPVDAAWGSDGGIVITSGTEFVVQDANGLYHATAYRDANTYTGDDGAFYSAVEYQDGYRFLVSQGGNVHRDRGPGLGGAYFYDLMWSGPGVGGDPIVDAFLEPGFVPNGNAWMMRSSGALLEVDAGTSAPRASVCVSPDVPDAGVSCLADAVSDGFAVRAAADGSVAAVYVLHDEDGDGTDQGLYHFDATSDTWTTLRAGDGSSLNDVYLAPDGSVWVAGITSGGAPLLSRYTEATGWVPVTFPASASGHEMLAVFIQADGKGWAVSDEGEVFVRSGQTSWNAHASLGLPGPLEAAILREDPDGRMWAFSDGLAQTPLFAYQQRAELIYEDVFSMARPTFTVTELSITADIGNLGGSTTDQTRPLTKVQFQYRLPGGTWQTLSAADDLPQDPSVSSVTRKDALFSCPSPDDCANMDVRFVLEGRTLRNLAETMRHDPGLTPMVGDVTVKFRGALQAQSTTISAVDRVAASDSDAVFSAAHQGYVLPLAPLHWSHVGITSDEGLADTTVARFVAAAESGFRSDATGPQIAILESMGGVSHTTRVYDIDGDVLDGAVVGTDILQGGDDIEQVVVQDTTGGSTPDIIMLGQLDGVEGIAARIWDLEEGVTHTSPNDADSDEAFFVVGTGQSKGRNTFAVVGDSEQVMGINGVAGIQEPSLKWAIAPGAAQGRSTFEYIIPDTALYGTGVVVSELTFDLTEGGVQVTQTARLVDWFNIVPPDRELPNPPVYTVEVVSWFNEG